MKEHPLLLSTPMVLAVLAGRKTVTRRTPNCTNSLVDGKRLSGKSWKALELDFTRYDIVNDSGTGVTAFKIWSGQVKEFLTVMPIYRKGDQLWFKETYRKYHPVDKNKYTDFSKTIIEYAADNPPMIPMIDADGWHMSNKDGSEKYIPWRASMFMPKAAARLWTAIPEPVRCEHLHDITEEQAIREGVEKWPDGYDYKAYGKTAGRYRAARDSFVSLWESINGPDSWALNLPVYAIPFNPVPGDEFIKKQKD